MGLCIITLKDNWLSLMQSRSPWRSLKKIIQKKSEGELLVCATRGIHFFAFLNHASLSPPLCETRPDTWQKRQNKQWLFFLSQVQSSCNLGNPTKIYSGEIPKVYP
mmetsp:Transcript_14208/g.23224  ORF Transcript_14208/g.23224 Transcript_14208/m.23224 type:complete len:106 (-) Transcript_14208:939-1256(-)